mmetsp:Transcript_6101/g.17861  ORF Transcript_6101/g.17861 Transcript_6101/m.17861 type:complete len:214 (-) Transcript_6101:6780-7421(-)
MLATRRLSGSGMSRPRTPASLAALITPNMSLSASSKNSRPLPPAFRRACLTNMSPRLARSMSAPVSLLSCRARLKSDRALFAADMRLLVSLRLEELGPEVPEDRRLPEESPPPPSPPPLLLLLGSSPSIARFRGGLYLFRPSRSSKSSQRLRFLRPKAASISFFFSPLRMSPCLLEAMRSSFAPRSNPSSFTMATAFEAIPDVISYEKPPLAQ